MLLPAGTSLLNNFSFISAYQHYGKSTCRQEELVSGVGKHPQRQITELGFGKKRKRSETGGLCYHFVLTGWYVYSSGVRAKLIGHRARDSQVCSGHNCDLVCYLSVDEGTLIKLNNERKTHTQMLVFAYLTLPCWFYKPAMTFKKCMFCTTRGGCWIDMWLSLSMTKTVCVPVGYRHLSLRGEPQTQRQTANTLFTSSTYTRGCGNFVNTHYWACIQAWHYSLWIGFKGWDEEEKKK